MKMSCAAALLAPVWACGPSAEPPPEYPPLEEPAPTTTVTVEQEPTEPVEPEPPPPPVQIVAGERTPIEGEAPSIALQVPRNNQLIRRGNVNLRIRLRNWELGADPGKHVHLIVDNEPYIALRDVGGQLNLNEIVQQNLGHELAAGTHVLRLFPSRAHHESVKEGSPFAMTVFSYQERTDGFEFDAEAPLLTYSRPKGCYPSGERVLLDFYVTNAEMGEEEGQVQVRYSIDEQVSGNLTSWVPYWIENLQPGEHAVTLELLQNGEPSAGMFNRTTRTITVADGQCPSPAPAQPAAADAPEEASE
jgi:hypothetical protein